jgi:myosin heavy subunit
MKEALRRLVTENAQLKVDKGRLQGALDSEQTLLTQVRARDRDINSLQNRLEQAEIEKDQLRRDLSNARGQLAILRRFPPEKEKETTQNDPKAAVATLQSSIQSHDSTLREQNRVLREEKSDLTSQKEAWEVEKRDMTARKTAWEQEKREMTTQKEILEEEKRTLTAENNSLEAVASTTDALQSENESLKEQKQALEEEVRVLEWVLAIVTHLLHCMWKWASCMYYTKDPRDRELYDGVVEITEEYLMVREIGPRLLGSWDQVFQAENSLHADGEVESQRPPWLTNVLENHQPAYQMGLRGMIENVSRMSGFLPPAEVIQKLERMDLEEQRGVDDAK